MFALFTDFTASGPYLGQLRAALHHLAPAQPVVDLMHDAPPFAPDLAAYLLEPVCRSLPVRCTVIAVVDPGVGSDRAALALEADGRLFIGPDNGLLEFVARRSDDVLCAPLPTADEEVAPTFHARDHFARWAAKITQTGLNRSGLEPVRFPERGWADDTPRIIYIDGYGNGWTGIRAEMLSDQAVIAIDEQHLERAKTFSDVPRGQGFWYRNSSGLVEIAVNCGRADQVLGLVPGSRIRLVRP
ncbi:SAM-dependent chlorinase/fluorinase [Methylonatrum kenyense]|uniref:SAM hydrolase/SAM-dependent halogenase family protein n=1 Tax=Methylonatrum kenyense TaxID=455253 RepID=UPI0020BD814F|nr:SAM-dependent chlorinase/fluorinase [Methylonatrum kenyense]MCK8516724.1 SAM-dependent chlorinase/fluorinase [Methylonatrum kenyense]